jgi:aldehyde dehydrogenase (NAD+)
VPSRYAEAVGALEMAYAGFATKWDEFNDPTCVMGPVNSRRQLDRVMSYIELGMREGARLLAGGNVGTDKGGGFFVEPTCCVDVSNQMRIAQEGIFGPVLVVIAFENDDGAVRIANDSEYGLSGMVVASGDRERGMRVARRLRTGTVSINGGLCIAPTCPSAATSAAASAGSGAAKESRRSWKPRRSPSVPSVPSARSAICYKSICPEGQLTEAVSLKHQ